MTLGGESIDVMAKLYTEGGYLADDATLRALACVKTAEDTAAVQTAVRSIYLPWLEDTARHFQQCQAIKSLPSVDLQENITVNAGECILFADGLRFDIGHRLAAMADERCMEVSIAWRWTSLPTVTATAKPLPHRLPESCAVPHEGRFLARVERNRRTADHGPFSWAAIRCRLPDVGTV
jgi:hypothetical protein